MCVPANAAAKFVSAAKERAESIVHTLEDPKPAEDMAGRAARKTAETAKITRDITTETAHQVAEQVRPSPSQSAAF